ncbi:LOW QUALITY PROTEIN: stAR-related lipid transfer protein 7, mitochondrial [Aegotheles albertisi]
MTASGGAGGGPAEAAAAAMWERALAGLLARWARLAPSPATPPPPALLARHCCLTGQRLRRARYRAGGDGGGGGWWGGWWKGPPRGRPAATGRLMAALAGVFVWDGQRIEEEELQRSALEMKRMESAAGVLQGGIPRPEPRAEHWEMIMDKKHFKLWRRPIEGTHLYQYRVFGSYTDVTPRQFFNVQLDTEYRKKWDSLVIKLDVIERDLATGSEVIHWVTHFPRGAHQHRLPGTEDTQADAEVALGAGVGALRVLQAQPLPSQSAS